MVFSEVSKMHEIGPALSILRDEWGWRHGFGETYSYDKRKVRFMDNEYAVSTKTCLTDYPSIEKLTITFCWLNAQECALMDIVQQSLSSWESSNYILDPLFYIAAHDVFHEFFPNDSLKPLPGECCFQIEHSCFRGCELPEGVAEVLHSFKEAVLNNYQCMLQKYLNECEASKEDR